jgi:hypothetical protein
MTLCHQTCIFSSCLGFPYAPAQLKEGARERLWAGTQGEALPSGLQEH